MNKVLLLVFSSLIFIACNKNDDPNGGEAKPRVEVSGLHDININQGFDTVIIPITVKDTSGAKVSLSILNLPENLTATIEPVDTLKGMYNIVFIAYYTMYQTPKSAPFGIVNARLIASTSKAISQYPFNINVNRDRVLSIAGKYREYCTCTYDTVSGKKVDVSVYLFTRPDTDTVTYIELDKLLIFNAETRISSCSIDIKTKTIPLQRCYTDRSIPILVFGSYSADAINFNFFYYENDTCRIRLER